ncbi:hypothetical protein RYH73_17605 [Olivibacter sp. CPCC 100613]|uniref:hypothetical protein n=1 Tax=Olivibacter sp. CPCC 100613 TaxID=3079931 RepID=UPI002FF7C377
MLNLVKGKPVLVTPGISDNLGKYFVDGDDATQFYAYPAAPINRVEVDLQGVFDIDRVLLRGFRGTDTLRIYTINGTEKKKAFVGVLPERKLISFTPVSANKLIIEYKPKDKTLMGELEVFAKELQPVMVNQSGYNTGAVKRFTAPLAEDGTPFYIVEAEGEKILFKGIIKDKIGDFTAFNPTGTFSYKVVVKGQHTGQSFPFIIAPYLIERVSYKPALRFMIDDRCWYGNTSAYTPTAENAGCPFLGVAWRDSHQFSFELQALINLYFSNPDAFEIERMPIEGQYLGLTKELPANTPEIVRLIYYAVDIYMRGKVNHTLLKEQLAYFLYAYPYLSKYIPQEVYEKARDYVFAMWANPDNGRWAWHDIEHNADLFQTYTVIGTGKGQFPPGHSIVPNLMLYEVAKREGRKDINRYWDAADKQVRWLIDNLDWEDPATTKGQRMNEYVTLQSLSYFLQQYPDKAPKGLLEKIKSWAEVVVERSDNLWDFRKYKGDKWVIPDIKPSNDPTFNPNGSFNEPGNIAGFPAAALAAKQVLLEKKLNQRLDELAVGHIDNVFGRNPTGRHYSYDACLDFEGADLGWFQEYEGGAGMLQTVRGVLDGSPKEDVYPYNPYGGDPGHTEGWVTFNTAWMEGIAYRNYDLTELRVLGKLKDKEIELQLAAPLNMNPLLKEKAKLHVTKNGKDERTIVLEEEGPDALFFGKILKLEELSYQLKKGDVLRFSYGFGHFSKMETITIH